MEQLAFEKKMSQSIHRHDLTDRQWALLESHLLGRAGSRGGVARNNRRFINAVLWVFRTGSPWRDLPAEYGSWSNTHRRFCRWRDKGRWDELLEKFIHEPDMEWLMIDATHCKVHQHAAGARGGNQAAGRTKGGNTKVHLTVDAHGMPLRAIVTVGTGADCTQASSLIESMQTQHLILNPCL